MYYIQVLKVFIVYLLLNHVKMKQKELKLDIKKLPAEEARFTLVMTPEQKKKLKLAAVNNNTTVKGMIFKAFGIE